MDSIDVSVHDEVLEKLDMHAMSLRVVLKSDEPNIKDVVPLWEQETLLSCST